MELQQRRTRPANEAVRAEVQVVVCTTRGRHLLDRLAVDAAFYEHWPTDAEPHLLGFECHRVLRDRFSAFDWCCYLEDDLVLHDPWLFRKLEWFGGEFGTRSVLMPNRFERGTRPLVTKAYVDGDLAHRVTDPWWDETAPPELHATVLGKPLVFLHARNPHSGCFFLSAEQIGMWLGHRTFLDGDTAFVGPLESAATLGLLKTFSIYKPARESASFLEIEHSGTRFIDQLRRAEDRQPDADVPPSTDHSASTAEESASAPGADWRPAGDAESGSSTGA